MELNEPSNNGDELLEIVSRIKGHKEVFDFYKEAQIHLAALGTSSFDIRNELSELVSIEENGVEHYDYDPDEHTERRTELSNRLEQNSNARKSLVSKFKGMAEDIFNEPDKIEDIDYQFDKVADNESVKNFRHYYELFCMYRYEFARRAEGIEPYQLLLYKDEHETHRAYHAVNQSMNSGEPIAFTFKLIRHRPYEQALRDLAAFQDNVKACMDVFYHMYKCIDGANMLNMDVVRDSKGRMADREHPSKLFYRWERCLLAYDMKQCGELKLADIARKSVDDICKAPKQSRQFNNDIDAASAAKKDIAEAERLIESASRGTFPY